MKKRLAYTLVAVLVGAIGFSSCNPGTNEPTDRETKVSQLTASTWAVNDITGLAGFTFSGTTTATFQTGEGGSFQVTGAENMARINDSGSQVDFPSSGTWSLAGTDENITGITLDFNGSSVTLTLSAISETALSFTYPAAEPKAADTGTATVSASPN